MLASEEHTSQKKAAAIKRYNEDLLSFLPTNVLYLFHGGVLVTRATDITQEDSEVWGDTQLKIYLDSLAKEVGEELFTTQDNDNLVDNS